MQDPNYQVEFDMNEKFDGLELVDMSEMRVAKKKKEVNLDE